MSLESSKRARFEYSIFELPAKVDKSYDYHMECYRKFTALSKAQREKMDCLKTLALIVLTTPTVSLDFKMRVLQ